MPLHHAQPRAHEHRPPHLHTCSYSLSCSPGLDTDLQVRTSHVHPLHSLSVSLSLSVALLGSQLPYRGMPGGWGEGLRGSLQLVGAGQMQAQA